ncbi:hypothetical protein E1265_06745 [Streptomyces sp. 8K308]|uniref:LOG family protein n=1 Tax=Streptomyces sp. 8K308 TaxID=2530388 RepID=UPI00104C0858|nr:LOG family protein [Streptomyces sp. 8K308]TDC25561.1 hypothetical protein E1265_06745 [Streptomyces sp. 8K308]
MNSPGRRPPARPPLRIGVLGDSFPAPSDDGIRQGRELGHLLGTRGYSILYQPHASSLKQVLAESAARSGAHVTGFLPVEPGNREGPPTRHGELLFVVRDADQARRMLRRQSDAFLVLPGGLETLGDAFQLISLVASGRDDRPVVLMETAPAGDLLREALRRLVDDEVRHHRYRLVHLAGTPAEALRLLESEPVSGLAAVSSRPGDLRRY